MKIPTEHQEQVTFVQWFEIQHKKVKIMAIPNGGKRNKITASLLKREGVKSGVPDLFVPQWLLWIEMKRQKGGSLSQAQREWKKYLEECGYTVLVTKGASDAISQVNHFLTQNKE